MLFRSLAGVVYLLRDEGAKFDRIGNQQEEPEEQDHAVGVAGPRVLDPLYGEDKSQRKYRQDGCPCANVAEPDSGQVDDLQDELGDGGGDNKEQHDLMRATQSQHLAEHKTNGVRARAG